MQYVFVANYATAGEIDAAADDPDWYGLDVQSDPQICGISEPLRPEFYHAKDFPHALSPVWLAKMQTLVVLELEEEQDYMDDPPPDDDPVRQAWRASLSWHTEGWKVMPDASRHASILGWQTWLIVFEGVTLAMFTVQARRIGA